jgi:hypothetical protein
MERKNPFANETFHLRVPLKSGECEVKELTIRPPLVKDILRTDGHDPESVGYVIALMSSLTGQPEILLEKMIPEDYADIRIIATQINGRFIGLVNLVDEKKKEREDVNENPTPPPISAPPSEE